MGQPEKTLPSEEIKLPPEFEKFSRPFGLEQHVVNILLKGILAHGCFFVTLYKAITVGYPLTTVFIGVIVSIIGGFGTTVGAHRYWTHKSFKATLPLQILLMLLQTSTGQYPIFKWCRDHRVHHKYTDTDADPHNSKRGFWFCHITWLFQPKHPELIKALRVVEVKDLITDPVVRFQSKYYWQLILLVFFTVPMTICKIFCPELSMFDLFVWKMSQFTVASHFTWLVNSAAHKWGDKPYDKFITPTDNKLVSILAIGEGWHNYHHTFPWDYKASEFGVRINLSTAFIHFFALIGWAYELKTVSPTLLQNRIDRTGDGSGGYTKKYDDLNNNNFDKEGNEELISSRLYWGWGDDELRKEDVHVTQTLFGTKQRLRSIR